MVIFKFIRLLSELFIPTGEGLPFIGKARQSEHNWAYVTFGATHKTGGKTRQSSINSNRNSLNYEQLRQTDHHSVRLRLPPLHRRGITWTNPLVHHK